jgi:hypothetical protein
MGLFNRVLSAFKSVDTAAPAEKPGRNEECWCGSGKKYKKCHLPEDDQQAVAKACSQGCGPT